MPETPPRHHRIDLARPLLIIETSGGMLACGYLNVETFNKTGEAAAIVTGVSDYDDMHSASIVAVSDTAKDLGVAIGDTGASALEKMGRVVRRQQPPG